MDRRPNPTLPISEGELLQLRDVVQAHSGIRIEPAKLRYLAEPLAAAVVAAGEGSLFDFNLRLMREMATPGSAAWAAVLPLVTINETYFFRETGQIALLRDELAPAMLRGRADKTLRVLSAPCSTGEEPYTIAIMLEAALARLGGARLELHGVDIDPVVIARARRGVYGPGAFRATDPAILQRHFRPDGDGWRVADALAARVRFQRGNLLEPGGWPTGGRLDVVFCRNLLIYFDRETQRRLAELAWRALAPGGVLMIGHAESLYGQVPGLEARTAGGTIYYRKPEDAPRARA